MILSNLCNIYNINKFLKNKNYNSFNENKGYIVLEIILNNIKVNCKLNNFHLIQKIIISDKFLYQIYKNIIFKDIPCQILNIFKFLSDLGYYLDNYIKNFHPIKLFFTKKNYRIILFIEYHLYNNSTINIFPWRTVIQGKYDETYDYGRNKNIKLNFYSIMNDLINFQYVKRITVITNIKKLKYKLNWKSFSLNN